MYIKIMMLKISILLNVPSQKVASKGSADVNCQTDCSRSTQWNQRARFMIIFMAIHKGMCVSLLNLSLRFLIFYKDNISRRKCLKLFEG